MNSVRSRVRSLAAVQGIFRGVHQVPFTLGLVFLLVQYGFSEDLAVASVMGWVHGIPRAPSFLLEIGGGVFSVYLGKNGSFKLLPISAIFGSLALVLQGLSFYFGSPLTILLSSGVGVFVVEICRALESGAFEDAYKNSSKYYIEDEAKLEQEIAELDLLNDRTIRKFQLLFAFLGSLFLIYCFNHRNLASFSWIFFFASLSYLYAFVVSLNWYKWASGKNLEEGNTEASEESSGEKIKAQLRHFIASSDLMNGLGFGIFMAITVAVITLSILTSSGVVEGVLALNRINFYQGLLICVLACLMPLSSLIGISFIKVGDADSFFNRMTSIRGILLTALWAVLAGAYTLDKSWGLASVIIVFFLATFLSPIRNWYTWLRIPLVRNYARKETSNICANHSFYYSLISGSREMICGIFGCVPLVVVKLGFPIETSYILMAILSTVITLFWFKLFESESKNTTSDSQLKNLISKPK